MLEKLKRLLGLEERSEYIKSYLERSNMEALRLVSLLFVVVSALALLTTFFPVPPWSDKSPETLFRYRAIFVIALAVAALFRLLSVRLLRFDPVPPGRVNAYMFGFIVPLMALSVYLAAFDYSDTRAFFAYVVVLVLLFGLFYVPPVHSVVLMVLGSAALIAALFAQGYHGFSLRMTIYAYAFIVVLVSGTNYKNRLRSGLANEAVMDLSLHDELTGVKNRRALDELAEGELGCPMHLLLGDIDEFKFYNDMYGHTAGDEMLRLFSRSLVDAFGEQAVYRYGGDEFVAVMSDASQERFDAAVKAWRSAFSEVTIGEEVLRPTTSGGWVHGVPGNLDGLHDMLRLADVRLYDAKRSGRNAVVGGDFDRAQVAELNEGLKAMHAGRPSDVDPLTGLPSMTYFSMHAKTVMHAPSLANAQFSIVYFNIENLKSYNERFGFQAGDELLVFVARTIGESFANALVSRFADDHFVMLSYGDDLIEGIERVRRAALGYREEATVIVRAGIYAFDDVDVEVSTACDRAKLACDHIKQRYNAFYCFYDENLQEERRRQQFVLEHFESALRENHIRPWYQPIIRCVSGTRSEKEALARWIDPDEGMVSPATFIPVLEEFRLIHRMDLHMVDKVCEDYRMLVDEGLDPVPATINLSRLDLELCDIVEEVRVRLERHGMPPELLRVEITESAFGQNQELLRNTIERFHELGLQVWMDDFGSGYSSLNVLREFRFDVVKIDLRFLRHQDADSQAKARQMLPHMVSMAKELGLQTLAEGVETESQLEFLKGIGCKKVQGYLLGKPGDVGTVREWLSRRPFIEPLSTRGYWDAIGRVNLMKPVSLEMEESQAGAGGFPTAIMELKDGKFRYLLCNAAFHTYLADIGMDSLEHSENMMNDMTRPQARGFVEAARRIAGTDEWLSVNFYEGEDLCAATARCVAVNEETDAIAFVYIALNMSKYLGRAGFSIPKHE